MDLKIFKWLRCFYLIVDIMFMLGDPVYVFFQRILLSLCIKCLNCILIGRINSTNNII